MKKRNLLVTIIKGYALFSTIYTGVKFLQCRGLSKEDDRHMLGRAIDRMYGYSIDHDDIITIDDTDLHVSYNPYMQLFTNSLGSIAVVINGTTEIYTDAHFRKMSKDTQYAILCHEMGHFRNKHTPSKSYAINRIKAVMKGGVLKMELEADAYACSIVGVHTMVSALKELKHYTSGIARKEIDLRIKAICNC